MGILQYASADIIKIELSDEGDFIEVRKDLSKREFNALMAAMPNRELTEDSGLTLSEGLSFAEALFEALVTGWSLPDDPTVENYLNLNRAAAEAVDTKLIEHFSSLSPTKDEESKAPTSRGKRQKESLPRI